MPFSHHHKQPNHVRFSDDIQGSEAGHRAQRAPKIETAAAAATSNHEEAPHFPNLYKMFKHKPGATSATTTDKGVIEKVETAVERKTVYKEEKDQKNVDTAATEYIKRKHHNMSLQKLVSMNAN